MDEVLSLRECRLCPRRCGVNRAVGQKGFCGEGKEVRAARAALHYWEEPCISGEHGSGTVFFSGCTMRCIYCQNYNLSRGEVGFEVSIFRLAKIFIELQDKGAHNINLVTPTQFVPQILQAAKLAREQGMLLPFVYNCGGYENAEVLKELEGTINIYLPDFKYWDDKTAIEYSAAPHYRDNAMKSLREMVRQTGSPVFDEQGIMQRGVIVRHLLLPGKENESRQILQYLHEEYDDRILISIMNQYTPMPSCRLTELQRAVSEDEYRRVVDFAVSIGIENAYIQEGGTVAESFIPAFNGEGII